MSGEWIRFAVVAVILIAALIGFTAAVLGVFRFGFVMNRLHAAGIGDTVGLFGVVLAMIIAAGLHWDTVKLVLIIFFMWFTSPASSHFLIQVEYFTNEQLSRWAPSALKPGETGHAAAAGEQENSLRADNKASGRAASEGIPGEEGGHGTD